MSKPQHLLAILSAMVAGAIVGVAVVLSRYVMKETTPEILALLRYSFGVLCFLPIAIPAYKGWFKLKDILPVAILGIGQFAILILLLNHSLNYISSARAALVFSTLPLQTMILAAVLGREKLTWQKSLGIILTILGLAVTEWRTLFSSDGNDQAWIGILLAAASGLCGATCSIFYRPYLERYATTTVSTFAMFASVAFLFLYSLPTDAFWEIPTLSDGVWWALVAVGASSGIGYFTWLWSLKHLAATTVTMFLCLGPITATLLGAIFLREAITTSFLAGLIIAIAGILIALAAKEKVTPIPQA
ncbi:DMT family transporter [Sneathiella limimaris]|uniref:DMT family transporter n=1 Tax=Sneathiella limimaris TaxID=1964213 RepID=UPI00146E27D6|nr:DMT family transporter [Sneathiella limimaris]